MFVKLFVFLLFFGTDDSLNGCFFAPAKKKKLLVHSQTRSGNKKETLPLPNGTRLLHCLLKVLLLSQIKFRFNFGWAHIIPTFFFVHAGFIWRVVYREDGYR